MSATGAGAFKAALDAMGRRAHAATREAMARNLRVTRSLAELTLKRYEHPPGVPTNSPRGQPPAHVTGYLLGSLSPTGPTDTGRGFTWQLGPTAVYSRIQELGGVCGAGHRTTLPARPYMRPTYDRLLHGGTWRRTLTSAWRRAL